MSDPDHTRLKDVFGALAALPPGPERAARMEQLCLGDVTLRARVEELLAFDGDELDDSALAPGLALRGDLDALWDQQGQVLQPADATDPARYEIGRLLGEGGFGSVYLAREREPIPRPVAIKVLKPGLHSRQVLERFDHERRTLALMDHPGIARVYAAGVDQRGRPYVAMEYVDGRPIAEFCDERSLGVRDRLELFVLVCQATQHAHYKGIVHRDIKPANVLVTLVDGAPVPKLIDFGIAKALDVEDQQAVTLTRAGQLVGTPLAMSPEQARGDAEVDTRADVYALGGLAYELLCGVPPFGAESATTDLSELRRQIIDEDPPRPSLRLARAGDACRGVASRRGTTPRALVRELAADLDWIVMRALEKQPERRYPTASDLALDVQRFLADEPVAACPPSRSYQAAKFVRRHRAGLAAALVMLVLLVAGIIGTSVGWSRSVDALEVARQQEALALESLARARAAEDDARTQASLAREESRHALAINAFLNDDLLGAVSPESQGFDVPMRRVLDVAAGKVGERFDGTPRTERAVRFTLGRTYRALALADQAEQQLSAALALLPPHDSAPEVEGHAVERAAIQLELGQIRLQQNRNQEAEQLLRRSWQECSIALGAEHALSIETLHFLGVSLGEQGRFDEAAQAFEASRAAATATLGEQHELSIQALFSQGLLRLSRREALGRPADAETVRLLEQAVAASASLHGPDDGRTIRRQLSFGVAVISLGAEPSRGLALLQEAYERSVAVQGPGHPTTAVAALNLGATHLKTGALALALPWLEQAHAIASTLGAGHPLLQRARFELAVARLYAGRFDDAEALAVAAYEDEQLTTLDDAPTPLQPTLADFLAEVCRQAGRADDAAAWAARAGGH